MLSFFLFILKLFTNSFVVLNILISLSKKSFTFQHFCKNELSSFFRSSFQSQDWVHGLVLLNLQFEWWDSDNLFERKKSS